MRSWLRLIFYLGINVLVSALTTWAVLNWWEARQEKPQVLVTPSASSLPAQLTLTVVDETQAPPASVPTMALTTYTVRPGDTLGSIALELDVDVETLMEINGLQDRDAIGANMVLFVPLPVSDQPPPEQTPTSAPTPAAYSSDDPQISIVSVVGAGDADTERVVLRRVGSGELSLAGWSLETAAGERYYFPQLILYADGAVSVHSAAGVNSVVDLYWGRSTAAWPSGSQVQLLDPAGELHASYRVP